MKWIFGFYSRSLTIFGPGSYMPFMTLRGARNYRRTFFGSIDPYGRYLGDRITFHPGHVFRRTPR